MTDEGPEERIDAGFVDRISESDSKDGVIDRSLISAPAWLMGGVTLFSVFVQSIIVSGGDIATAIRVIAIADRAKMLALAVCTVAGVLLDIVPKQDQGSTLSGHCWPTPKFYHSVVFANGSGGGIRYSSRHCILL